MCDGGGTSQGRADESLGEKKHQRTKAERDICKAGWSGVMHYIKNYQIQGRCGCTAFHFIVDLEIQPYVNQSRITYLSYARTPALFTLMHHCQSHPAQSYILVCLHVVPVRLFCAIYILDIAKIPCPPINVSRRGLCNPLERPYYTTI